MIDAKTFQRYASDPAAFRADLQVDVDGVARRFGDVQDPWQRADFASLDPALKRCAGRSDAECKMRAYLERPRGHSKTTDLAVTGVWALAFATRPIRGYCYAADKDQARLLRDAMETLIRLNPWLAAILTVEAHLVKNTAAGHPGEGGTLTIEASDVGSSYGILPDLIIADELVHWQGDGGLWNSLISSAAKRSNCLMVVISNAGFADSWQWGVREAARTDEAWIFSRLDGPVASWITPARLAEQSRMLPPVAYARLWLNRWSSGGGDALRPEDIDACFLPDLQPMTGSEPGWIFVLGCDLGLVRDYSAICVLAVPAGGVAGRIRLAHHRVWRPVAGQKIELAEVEREILECDARYNLEAIGADPWQSEGLIQKIEAATAHRRRNQRRYFGAQPWARTVPPTSSNLRQQATLTLECFADHRLMLYPCPQLRSDLLHLRVEERGPSGFRLVSPRGGGTGGHGDLFSAMALALVLAHDYAGRRPASVTVICDSMMPCPSGPVSPTGAVKAFNQFGERAMDRALRAFDAEAVYRKAFYDGLSRPEDPQAGFREMLRQYAPERYTSYQP